MNVRQLVLVVIALVVVTLPARTCVNAGTGSRAGIVRWTITIAFLTCVTMVPHATTASMATSVAVCPDLKVETVNTTKMNVVRTHANTAQCARITLTRTHVLVHPGLAAQIVMLMIMIAPLVLV